MREKLILSCSDIIGMKPVYDENGILSCPTCGCDVYCCDVCNNLINEDNNIICVGKNNHYHSICYGDGNVL